MVCHQLTLESCSVNFVTKTKNKTKMIAIYNTVMKNENDGLTRKRKRYKKNENDRRKAI
jgi:hypothetical protein